MNPSPAEASGGDPARLRAIRRHLASVLPAHLLDRFWHGGFASVRQPSFRLNALRLCRDAGGDGDGDGSDGVGDVVRQLLDGFGLPPDTPLERCPYHTLARLLPTHTATVIRVAEQAHSLSPMRTGAVYFMGLSSMLPALALMAHQPPRQPQQQQQQRCPAGQFDSQKREKGGRSGGTGGGDSVGGGFGEGVGGGGGLCKSAGIGSGADSGGGGGSDDSGGSDSRGGVEVGMRPLRVLDLCAAPGGKTALLAELLGNSGTLLAVDASWPRLQRLQFNLDRLVPNRHNDCNHRNQHDRSKGGRGSGDGTGYASADASAAAAALAPSPAEVPGPWWRRGCVVAVHADGTRLRVDEHGLPLVRPPARRKEGRGGGVARGGGSFRCARSSRRGDEEQEGDEGEIGVYDRVLVDAPCSGLGRLQLQRPSSYSRWDESYVAHHPERQRQLLLRGVRLLRRGGSLVYSTCTIDPRENEAVVAWLLGRVGGLRLVEPRLVINPRVAGPRLNAAAAAARPAANCTGTLVQHLTPPMDVSALQNPNANLAFTSHSTSPTLLSLREALEAHRPGCTYPALLDGSWWEEAMTGGTAGGNGGGGGGGRYGSGQTKPFALRLFGDGVAAAAVAAAAAGSGSREWLRKQLESCCVRVAPGPTYEGFFLAQFVKE